jgi:nitrile hydratase accessory protein
MTTSTAPDIKGMAAAVAAPAGAEGPVFAEPWQAQAFALAVSLNAKGFFTWSEWSRTLGARIASAPGGEYYEHWLGALESLLAAKGLADPAALADLKSAWADAYRDTPHGKPVHL